MPEPVPAGELASRLRVSTEAVELTRACGVVDLHLDTFIPHRLWGYDWYARHEGGPLGRFFFGHVDWPRAQDGGLVAGMWSITTNPFRSAASRWAVFQHNLRRLQALIDASGGAMRRVTTHAEYVAARAEGKHAAMIAIQGGNALDAAPEGVASIPGDAVVRVTLVHLTNAALGTTNSPVEHFRSDKGLTDHGRTFVRRCNERRVFVDLAHIHERAFWDAVEVHDKAQPLIATHAGVEGVRPHWRNLDDAQLRVIAETGGVVGAIFEPSFLRRPGGPADTASMVVEHLEHVVKVAGEDAPALGSDFDGAIRPGPDLRGADHYPVLVQRMLDRRWPEERIRKTLRLNFEAAFQRLRP